MQDADQQDGDRLAEVKRSGRGPQQFPGVADVCVEVSARTFRRTGEQRPSVREDHRVVVHVDDPALRRQRLGDFIGVVRHRQPSADIEELTDARSRDQVTHRRDEESALRLHPADDLGVGRLRLLADLAISLEVVFAAQLVVIDPGWMRHRRVIRGRRLGQVTRVCDEFVGHDAIMRLFVKRCRHALSRALSTAMLVPDTSRALLSRPIRSCSASEITLVLPVPGGPKTR